MNTETSEDMSSLSTQANHEAGSETKRKFLAAINLTRAMKSKDEDCVRTENCGLPTTIEVLTSNGQTVPLQRATTQETDVDEACTLGNEITLLVMDSFPKQFSGTRTDSNVDFSESVAPTELPVAEFQHKNDAGDLSDDLSWLINFKPGASSIAAEVEDGHKGGGGNNNNGLIDNRQQHQPDLKLPVRPKRRRQRKRRAEKIKGTAMGHPVEKIRRPPNAFMFFSNEWRKKIAAIYPEESNRQISVRLGGMWKGIEGVHKNVYFALARQAEAEHKKKYPDYVYIPVEARTQKLLREQARDMKFGRTRRLTTAQTSSARPLPAEEHQKGGTTGTPGVASSEGQNKISQNSAPYNTQSATAGISELPL
ncbi:uncharacterized protein LOC110840684 [Zootermopsis nevadensis]|uniref:Sex-determining region Y protein n=1 Tax=Zootermopsis nevadensis TaxID=136037 RepID=A0A067QHN1_ZOONE|nr:uncharacterized protein LOC110840684 [Zootermopsis nevadensis]KDR04785.1 Sex-determining region Y protein [Zootermopsis nevadensis]